MRRWTEEEVTRLMNARAVGPTGVVSKAVTSTSVRISKPTKYRSQAAVIDGIRFASKLESRCYLAQKLRQAAGEVLFFVMQVPFLLEGGVIYRADVLAVLAAGGVEVIDATGKMTSVKLNKLRQVKARYGISVLLWTDKQ